MFGLESDTQRDEGVIEPAKGEKTNKECSIGDESWRGTACCLINDLILDDLMQKQIGERWHGSVANKKYNKQFKFEGRVAFN